MATKREGPLATGRTLSERERRFVEAYMGEAGGNATQAALIAGYARSGAHVTASRLLRKAKIREAIEERQKADPLVMTREEAMRRLSAVGRGDCVVVLRDRLSGFPVLHKDDSSKFVYVPASDTAQLKAIETLAKISGWTKEQDSGNDRLNTFLAALAAANGAQQ